MGSCTDRFRGSGKNTLLSVVLIMASSLAFSCATTQDMENLQKEVDALKVNNSDMETKLKDFLSKYDSQLRKELDLNISQIEIELQRLETAKDKALQDSGLISQYLESSRKDKEQTARNRLESDSQNVVNEFDDLKTMWQETKQQLQKYANDAQKAAISSDIQAQSAYKSVVELEIKMSKVESFYKSLNDWASKFDGLQADMDKYEKSQKDTNQNLDAINKSMAQLNLRMQLIEKQNAAIGDIQKQVDKINSTLALLLKRIDALEKTEPSKPGN
jgi:hypothetical protein